MSFDEVGNDFADIPEVSSVEFDHTEPLAEAEAVEPSAGEATQPTVELPDQTLSTAESDKMMQECCGLRISKYGTWPTGSRAMGKETKLRIAESEGIDVDQISVGMRLYDPKQDLVSKALSLSARISSYVKSMTLPLAKAGVSEPSAEGGTYLVRRDQVDLVHLQMVEYKVECDCISQELNANRAEVLASCEAKLQSKYNENLYPDKWELSVRWGFPNVSIPSYLEQLAPKAYEHELMAVRQRFEDSYQLATESVLSEFSAVVNKWVERLSPVTRIYPKNSSDYFEYHGAELFDKVDHNEDSSVPEGQLRITIRHKPIGARRLQTVSLGPMTGQEFLELEPMAAADEKKSLHTSTVQDMFDMIKYFRNVGSTISAGPELVKAIDDAAENLKDCDSAVHAQGVLKGINSFRIQTRSLMSDLSQRLDDQITTTKKGRRKIVRNVKKKS